MHYLLTTYPLPASTSAPFDESERTVVVLATTCLATTCDKRRLADTNKVIIVLSFMNYNIYIIEQKEKQEVTNTTTTTMLLARYK
jgi:hypothetical protein